MISYDVALDPGHGGYDSGIVSNGLAEKTLNLVTSLECKRILELNGLKVFITRTTDTFVELNERCRLINNSGAKLAVSIHYNGGQGDGAEAFYSIHGTRGKEFANKILNEIHTVTGQNLRTAKTKISNKDPNKDYYCVIRGTTMPLVICEGAFLDSNDYKIVDTETKQKLFGKAIAQAILKHLNINFVNPTEVKPVPKSSIRNGNINKIGTVIARSGLTIRNGRGTIYDKIGTLKYGEKVRVLYSLNKWLSIDVPISVSKSGIGYVSAEWINLK